MNKIVNINLGGYPFSIDEDAYEHLNDYLNTIDRHFRTSEGYEEITTDIENRLAELFQEQLAGRPIVTKDDVKAAIAIMGTPEEFGAEPMQESSTSSNRLKTGKRLFRNPEDEVLGGVCAGLAAYFGIKDAVWIRLILAILALSSFGFLIPAYIIAWILVPKAATASDRLAMRGEPVNVSNIGKIVEEELYRISGKLSEMGGQINYKEGAAATGNALRDGLTKVFAFVGKAVQALADVIKQIWKPFVFLFILLFALAFIGIWIAGVFAAFSVVPFSDYIQPNQGWLAGLGLANLFMMISIPVLGFLLFFVRLLTGFRLNGYAQAGLGIFWTVNFISFVAIAGNTARNFQTESSVTQTLSYPNPSDTIHLMPIAKNPFHYGRFQFSIFDRDLIQEDNQLLSSHVNIEIGKSDNGELQIEQLITSRGRTIKDAETASQMIDYSLDNKQSTLYLPTYYSLNKGEKFRAQQVTIKVLIPESRYLKINDGLYDKIRYLELSNGEWLSLEEHHLLQMGADGLACLNCEENPDSESTLSEVTEQQ